MEKVLQVDGTEFWAHHLDFHRPVARAPALVGRSRAREMVINVVLPFFLPGSTSWATVSWDKGPWHFIVVFLRARITKSQKR